MPDPLLEVRGIDAFYGDFQALFGVSLRVETGQVIAVIGANGAGKSTLLKSIVGMMHPHQGEILLDDDQRQAFADNRWQPRIDITHDNGRETKADLVTEQ